ncbi:LysM domain-containing protein [Enterovibrio norvegicus]|uniref:LysM domain-containing protein n=1 Tax=Enterovibrio norvegicus TaxID=188144 RepID=UPI003550645D
MTDLSHYLLSNTEETADFTSNSRYVGLPLRVMSDANGIERVFVSRRFLPQPASTERVQSLVVREGDRLDLLGAAYYADPSKWWCIADANLVQHPGELVSHVGRRIALKADDTENGSGGR